MRLLEKNNKKQSIYLILVIIWMITVFTFSNEQGEDSGATSSGVTEKIVNVVTLSSNKSQEEKNNMVMQIDPVVRKLAHYTIYLIGGILIINYIYTYKIKKEHKIIISISIGAVYAMTDEIHQYFVPGRSSMITDVGIDTLGVITGVIIYLCVLKIIKAKLQA